MAAPSPEPPGLATSPAQVASGLRVERLSQAERTALALEILIAYARARRQLRRAPIAEVVGALRSLPARRVAAEGDEALLHARRLGRAVTRLLGLLPGDTRCLVRSLVLTRLLARRGIPAKLVIGARAAPEFLAHAWVEYAGDPVLDVGDGSFGRLVEL
ncbi:MAG TPA: lasso peptide biosynthesis B2 protein [Solirubrobacteraceae bacterium]|nr:lasso peptide biosynthesis B2 protein [Solirubrobacteraceae bacterium]